MVKGLSRQSVYPMEATKTADHPGAPTYDSTSANNSVSSSANDSASSDRREPKEPDKLDIVAAFHRAQTSDAQDERAADSASQATQIQTLGQAESSGDVVQTVGGSEPDGGLWNNLDTVQGLSSRPSQQPSARAKGGGGTTAGGGRKRRLTFADETGGALAEVSYSTRTHYSKQTGPSALGGTGRACCVIS